MRRYILPEHPKTEPSCYVVLSSLICTSNVIVVPLTISQSNIGYLKRHNNITVKVRPESRPTDDSITC